MDHARVGRALLALCGHRAGEVRDLDKGDWIALDGLAHQHRLRPYLHARHGRSEIEGIPEHFANVWQEAHRANAMMMLVQRRALLQAVGVLSNEGIDAVALKGSALAWTVWPSPAERVMRDIDLLVSETDGPRAYRALRAAGWNAPGLSDTDAQHFAQSEAHFPPLHSPEGVMCELHAHAWGKPPLPGSGMPRRDDAGLLARAANHEALGAKIPAPEDMLAHLVVHAACSHLLNVGPMALVDIDLWCAENAIDWTAFWERADDDGLARPAALVFALVDRWRKKCFLKQTLCPITIAGPLLDDVELLLVQDLDARKDVSVIASLSHGRLSGRIEQHPLDRAEEKASATGRISQLAERGLSLTRSLLSGRTRRDGLATARLQDWIES